MDDHWITTNFDTTILDRICFSMHACAYRADENSSPTTEARWVLLFQYEADACVRVEMTRGYGMNGRRGKIHLSNVTPFFSAWNSHTCHTFPTRNFPTVQEFMDIIISEGRQRYTFNDNGEGYRFWEATVIEDFTKARLLPKDSSEEFMKSLRFDWYKPEMFDSRPVKEGSFLPVSYDATVENNASSTLFGFK
jgi:hypothetical protein